MGNDTEILKKNGAVKRSAGRAERGASIRSVNFSQREEHLVGGRGRSNSVERSFEQRRV